VLEGVACGLAQIYALIGSLGGGRGGAGLPAQVRVSGGGARSTLWLQIIASVLGVPVARMEVDEGAAYGAALLGGVAAGVYGSVAEAASLVRVRDEVQPRAEWVEAYAGVSARFADLYPALRGLSRP
jgi:xylulokinase